MSGGPDAFVGVPMDSSGTFDGCERMPAALRTAGVVDRLGLQDLGNLQAVISDPRRHPGTGVIGWDDWLNATEAIGTSIASLLAVGATPLVSGGDCSMLPGIVAAIRESVPACGLLFVDGHLDSYDGSTSPTGEAADMDLSMVLTGWPGGAPLLGGDRVVVIGARDSQEALSNAGAYDPGSSGAAVHPWSARFDPEVVAIATGVALDGWGGHWLHVDLDVLSTTTMPAVDYPQPGGLTWEDLAVVLRPAFGDARLLGMSVADLNPTLDVDGRAAEATVELLVSLQAGL